MGTAAHLKFTLRADGGAEALPAATKKEGGGEGEVQGETLRQVPTAGPGLVSLDGSGGDVDVEISQSSLPES